MKKTYQAIITVVTASFLTACIEAVEKTNLGSPTDDIVWSDAQYVKRHFDYVMSAATPNSEVRQMAHSDEGYVYEATRDVVYDESNANDADGGASSTNVDRWPYDKLREINRFLDHAGYEGFASPQPVTADLPQAEKEDMIGHLLVLRAYHYFDMVRTYGGVPLMLHEQEASSNLADMYSARAKTSECIAQIIKDLDAAIALPDASFPMKRTDGHIGKAVAYALKGRVLLYYASPQFTRQTPAGTKTVDQRRNEAYAACKEAYEKLGNAGYGLYAPDGGNRQTVMDNYYKMLVADEMNKEMVWVRRYEPIIADNGMDNPIRPNSSAKGGIPSVYTTWEMTTAFAKADGTPFVPAVPVDNSKTGIIGDHTQGSSSGNSHAPTPDGSAINTSVFWLDREPRFYAFIGYNGCHWPLIRREQSLMSGDVVGEKMQHEWIFCWGSNDNKFPFDNGYSNTNGRGSSFFIRKFVSNDRNYEITDVANPLQSCGTDWPLIRFTEVALNYAEAAAVTGKSNEAYAILDAIRKRAGIPQANNYGLGRKTGDALILDILNERRIELFVESHRYYDARRWDLYAKGLAGYKINGMRRHALQAWLRDVRDAADKPALAAKIQGIIDAGGIDTQAGRDAYFAVFYHTAMLHDLQPISYNPARQDFLRIPYAAHIMKNPTIEQTMGWTDERGAGKFNPYE